MIDTLCKMVLSVTYDRVLCMFADLANSAINHFEAIGAVCPQSLKLGLFTTSAVDNIDHDSTLTSAQTSFHGTGISLFQHPDVHNVSIEQAHYPLANSNCKIVKLPNDYTSVPAVMGIKDPPIPEINELKKADSKVDLVAESQKHNGVNMSVIPSVYFKTLTTQMRNPMARPESMYHGLLTMLTMRMKVRMKVKQQSMHCCHYSQMTQRQLQ
jgi:hypothetical protein